MDVPGYKPTARLIITSTKVDPAKLKALEDILYGTEDQDARLPLPEEVIQLLKPSVAVTASPESADATLFGKKVSDLQQQARRAVRPLPGPEVRRDSD